MPAPDPRTGIVKEWVDRAEDDRLAARQLLRLGKAAPVPIICFHAQQAAEKYLKSLIVSEGLEVPRTHQIDRLLKIIARSIRPDISADDADLLTDYAVAARYPGERGPTELREARLAIKLTEKIRRQVRTSLPTGIFKRHTK